MEPERTRDKVRREREAEIIKERKEKGHRETVKGENLPNSTTTYFAYFSALQPDNNRVRE